MATNSNIFAMGTQHFSLVPSAKGKVMTITTGGQVFILFRNSNSEVCKMFDPIYRSLASTFIGAKFTIVDTDAHREVINKSRETAHPVQSVPTLFFYNEKFPFAKYKGEFNRNEVAAFVNAVIESSSVKRQAPQTAPVHHQNPYQQPPMHHSTLPVEEEDDDKLALPNMAFLPKERPWDQHH